MGLLTVVVVHNDGLGAIRKNGEQVIETLHYHAAGNERTNAVHFGGSEGKGEVKFFQPRHSSEDTLYLLTGNSMYEISGSNYEGLDEAFVDTLIKRAEENIKLMKEARRLHKQQLEARARA